MTFLAGARAFDFSTARKLRVPHPSRSLRRVGRDAADPGPDLLLGAVSPRDRLTVKPSLPAASCPPFRQKAAKGWATHLVVGPVLAKAWLCARGNEIPRITLPTADFRVLVSNGEQLQRGFAGAADRCPRELCTRR